MTIVFVDGPDGTGKTGYGEWLARNVGYTFIREHESTHELGLEGIEHRSIARFEMVENLDDEGIDMVVDRSPLSSIVYGEIHGRATPDIPRADDLLQDIDANLVYFHCDPMELSIRYDDDLQDDIAEIASVFNNVVEDYRDHFAHVYEVDTTTGAMNVMQQLVDEVSR